MNSDRLLYVYLDWTLENVPRCFYVGKGDDRRVKKRDRNEYWKRIAAKYGWRREVILVTKDPVFVIEQEKEWIVKMDTFHFDNPNGCGCNFTRGGEGGCFGWKAPPEWCASRSKENNPMYGKKDELHPVYGRKQSILERSLRRERMLGERNPMFGKQANCVTSTV